MKNPVLIDMEKNLEDDNKEKELEEYDKDCNMTRYHPRKIWRHHLLRLERVL